jgi:peptide-methionine (S)-S-oxide reductase
MSTKGKEIATLAGGCFWCLEAVYELIEGVESVQSGYSGGHQPYPSYQAVCSGTTGHAEVVQVTFDSEVVSYSDVLEVFFAIHDPTTKDRQGADVGTQYRSEIFYHSEDQRVVAEEMIKCLMLSSEWDGQIVTGLSPLGEFYQAEDYHQEYYRSNRGQPYCEFVISPKVSKIRELSKEKSVSITLHG